MARKPRIDPIVKVRARKLKAEGRSRDQVQKALAAEGHHVSAGWLTNTFHEVAPSPRAEWDKAAGDGVEAGLVAAPPDDEAIEAAEAIGTNPDATIEDLRAALGALVPLLRAMLQRDGSGEDCGSCGRGESNIDGVAKLTRALIAAGGLVVKVAPKAAADPNQDPDYIEKARLAREKLLSMAAAERAALEAGAAA